MKKKFFVDLLHNTVEMDKKFIEKAGQFGSTEFNEYMELRKALPDFEFVVKNLNESQKNTYSDLTYDVMEAFINFHEGEVGRVDVIAEYRAIRAESVFKKAPYAFVKSWFLKKYKTEYNKSTFAEERKSKKEEAIIKLNNSSANSLQ